MNLFREVASSCVILFCASVVSAQDGATLLAPWHHPSVRSKLRGFRNSCFHRAAGGSWPVGIPTR